VSRGRIYLVMATTIGGYSSRRRLGKMIGLKGQIFSNYIFWAGHRLETGVIKAEVETRKNASILPFMDMRRDSGGYNTSERADTHPNNPETWASEE